MHARFRAQFWKTETCRFWRSGCRNADSCPFAHGEEELHQRPDLVKTSLCQRWAKGTCPLEAHECRFAHGPLDLRTTPNYAKSTNSKADAGGPNEAPVPNRSGQDHHAAAMGSLQNGTPLATALPHGSADQQAALFDTAGMPGGAADEAALEQRQLYGVPPPPASHPAGSVAAPRQRRAPPGQGGFRNSHGYAMGGGPAFYSGWEEAGPQKPEGHHPVNEQGSKELLFVGPPPEGSWAPSADTLPPPSDLLVSINGPHRLPGPPPMAAPPPPAPQVPPMPLGPPAGPACGNGAPAGYPPRYCDQMSSPDFADNLGLGHTGQAFALNGVNGHEMHNGVRMGWPTNGHAVNRTNGHMASNQMANLFMANDGRMANGPVDPRAYHSQPETAYHNQPENQADNFGPPLSSMPWPGQSAVPEELRAIWS